MPRKRHVLFLADELDGAHGGTEGQLQLLIRHLPSTWQITLCVLRDVNDLAREAFPSPIRSLKLGRLKSPRTLRRVRAFAREIQAMGVDVIHGVLADTCLIAPLLGHWANIPVVTSRRDLGYWQTPRVIEALRRMNRWADAIIANAQVVGERTVALEHALPAQVRVIANGHPLARFETPPSPTLRDELGIPTDARIVGLLANFRPLKRVEDLIDAVADLGETSGDVHVLLIGHGPEGADHLRHAAERGLGGRVHIHGVIGDVIPVLKHLDIGVLCSSSEGLSNAIIEYMGCGLPVVASAVGGNPELVENDVTGALYPAGDVAALSRILGRLLADPAEAARQGLLGRRRFEERYTVERMVAQTLDCYEAVLARRKEPSESLLQWRLVTSIDELETLRCAWEALLTDRQFFCGPTWALTWMRTHGAKPCVPVATDAAGKLVGLLPLIWGPGRTLVVCGGGQGTDHVDVVSAPGRALDVARGALRTLEAANWSRLQLEHVSEDAALRQVLRDAGQPFPYGERYATVCPFVRPGDDYGAYLERQMHRRKRSTLRRKTKRFLEREGAHIRRVRDASDAASALDELLAMHAQRFEANDDRSSFAGEAVRAFHHALCDRLAREGRLLLIFLEAEGKPASAIYTIRQGRSLGYFQTSFAPAFRDASPGLVLQGRLIAEDVVGAGLEELDFLDGDEAYKLSWATGARRLFDVGIYPATRGGRLRAILGGLNALGRQEVKRLLGALGLRNDGTRDPAK